VTVIVRWGGCGWTVMLEGPHALRPMASTSRAIRKIFGFSWNTLIHVAVIVNVKDDKQII